MTLIFFISSICNPGIVVADMLSGVIFRAKEKVVIGGIIYVQVERLAWMQTEGRGVEGKPLLNNVMISVRITLSSMLGCSEKKQREIGMLQQ